ncbi:MAG: efflux RND transporter permease subunit, partial [Spirochaetales bacterium]|nr:efflux RND transporter permease subunit [Spirochaetales bacterium]
MYIANLSIKRPVLVTMFMTVLLLFGIIGYMNLPLNLMPEAKIPFVTVQTIYPGASPIQIETLITKKIEDEIGSISRIKKVNSFSLDSVSIVLIEFELEKDPDVANQEVKDKVDAIINKLPEDAEIPVIEKLDITATPILDLVIGGNIDATDLLELVDLYVKDSISRVDGVGSVSVTGGRDREIRVEFDNKVVFENSISLIQVGGILSAANKDMPGGDFQSGGQDFSVRLKGELSSIEELKNLDIPTASGIKKLRQLADIVDSGADVRKRTIFYDNTIYQKQDTSILLSVIKSPDGNAVEVAEKVRKILPKIQSELPLG